MMWARARAKQSGEVRLIVLQRVLQLPFGIEKHAIKIHIYLVLCFAVPNRYQCVYVHH